MLSQPPSTVQGAPTMSSIELVEVINSMREEGRPELRHDNFMSKIESHPGITSPKFLGHVNVPGPNGSTRKSKCYFLPKRECELMVMGESRAVQAKVYDRMAMLEAGAVSMPRARLTVDPALSAFRRARAIEVSGKTASDICNRFPGLSVDSQQVIYAKLVNQAAGETVVPLPEVAITYSAGEVGGELGVTANAIGRMANANGVKTSEFGITVLDKSASSDKQMPTFRYNAAGVKRLRELFSKGAQP